MANLTIRYFSNCLNRNTSFEMVIPNDPRLGFPYKPPKPDNRPLKVLFLLRGYSDGVCGSWIPEYLLSKYRFAVVVPNGENSFYLDGRSTGHAFESMVALELVDYIRSTFHLALTAEDTYILGMSMGGFGALHTSLAHPDRFSKCGAMSSALIMHEVADMKDGIGNDVANYDYYRECFGEPSELLDSPNNPETLVQKAVADGKSLPAIYMCCGTEDFLLEPNRAFHNFLNSCSVAHEYVESPGNHDMFFWNEYTLKILEWMFAD